MASLVLPVFPKKKRSRNRKINEEKKWNPVNPKTPTQKARAVIGSLVKTLQEVIDKLR